jgi:hypothetical protein
MSCNGCADTKVRMRDEASTSDSGCRVEGKLGGCNGLGGRCGRSGVTPLCLSSTLHGDGENGDKANPSEDSSVPWPARMSSILLWLGRSTGVRCENRNASSSRRSVTIIRSRASSSARWEKIDDSNASFWLRSSAIAAAFCFLCSSIALRGTRNSCRTDWGDRIEWKRLKQPQRPHTCREIQRAGVLCYE